MASEFGGGGDWWTWLANVVSISLVAMLSATPVGFAVVISTHVVGACCFSFVSDFLCHARDA
jgi:hypothetical protein